MFELLETNTSSDGSQKFLWKCADGAIIESVLLPRNLKQKKQIGPWSGGEAGGNGRLEQVCGANDQSPQVCGANDRWTVCVSSQVGCAMACAFCATGKLKLTRNLSAEEIVGQVIELKKIQNVTNVVFMGMGEPLHNLPAVKSALRILYEQHGFSRRKITVSTSGWIPGILELAEDLRPRLAISLNASTDESRAEIMPINKKFPMADLIEAAKKYSVASNMSVVLEYVLFAGKNDSVDDANRLFEIAKDWNCQINLIPYNTAAGEEFKRPEPLDVKAFQHSLVSRGITTTVRYSGADDVNGACGQLQRRRSS